MYLGKESFVRFSALLRDELRAWRMLGVFVTFPLADDKILLTKPQRDKGLILAHTLRCSPAWRAGDGCRCSGHFLLQIQTGPHPRGEDHLCIR